MRSLIIIKSMAKKRYVCTKCGRVVEQHVEKEEHAFNSPPECCGLKMFVAS